MRTNRAGKLGLLLIAIATVPWAGWTLWDHTRTWFFVKDLPLTLSNGNHVSVHDVRPNMNALYSVEVNAQYSDRADPETNSEAARELACQIGLNTPSIRCESPPLWNFRWKLTSGGVTQVDSAHATGQGWIDTSGLITRELGTFRSKAGQNYTFDLEVQFDNHDPKITNPRLTVAIADYHTESSLFLTGMLTVICGPVAVIGVFLLLGSLLYQRMKPQPSDANP